MIEILRKPDFFQGFEWKSFFYLFLATKILIFQESSPDPGLPENLAANASLDISKLILPGLGGSLDPAGVGAAGVGGLLDDPTTGSALQNLAKIASRYSKVCTFFVNLSPLHFQ